MSLQRQLRRAQAKQLASKILDTYGGKELPTVEQLYTLIGAKDGFIYDLQLQLSGMNQEYQKVVEERDTLKEQLDEYQNANTGQMGSEPRLRVVPEPVEMTSQDPETDFGATHRPH